ncbi:hypothetical protein EAO70_10525 [Streptomyces sp. adm13(2018)]|nr:hypothetical protein EAO70_10525 [Streptomyces sp. adm13(2018)]
MGVPSALLGARPTARFPARRVSSPAVSVVRAGTSPVPVRVSGPSAGTGAGWAVPSQVTSVVAPFWPTPTVSAVSARTVAASRAVSSAATAAGSSSVVLTPAASIVSPTDARSGTVALIRTVAGCGPEGRVQR